MSILLVEGSMETRFHMRLLLRQSGHKDITAAQSGRGAKRLLQHGELGVSELDLVIVNMNDEGVELCEYLSQNPVSARIPVLAVVQSDAQSMAAALACGATDVIAAPWKDLEFTTRVRMQLKAKYQLDALRSSKKHLVEVSHQLREANQMLQKLSALDGLTGITNRRAFDEMLSSEWKRALREDQPMALVLLDIDYFKAYNDQEGHQAGDQCLARIAQVLQSCLRRAGDVVGRWGGEEFCVLLPNTGLEGAAAVAESMRRAVEALQIPHGGAAPQSLVTVSGGAASQHPSVHGGTPEQLLALADEALYAAKRSGRNQIKRQSLIPAEPALPPDLAGQNGRVLSNPFGAVQERIDRLEKIVAALAPDQETSLGSLSDEELQALLSVECQRTDPSDEEDDFLPESLLHRRPESPVHRNRETWQKCLQRTPYVFAVLATDGTIEAASQHFGSAVAENAFLSYWEPGDEVAIQTGLQIEDGCEIVEARLAQGGECYRLHFIRCDDRRFIVGHSLQELKEATEKLAVRTRLLKELSSLT